MPKGVPRIGSTVAAPEVLGTIPSDHTVLDPTPQGPEAVWQTESGTTVSFSEEPPPWEVAGGDSDMSDARRYVEAPQDVTLRWINPKLLESQGWRDWRPVLRADRRFKVLVDSMVAPDGNIRRGGTAGDILAFMPTHWVVKRREILEAKTRAQSQSAVEKQSVLNEELKRIHPGLGIDRATHPRYTNADGRTMVD